MGRARDLIPPPVVVLAEDDGLPFVRAKFRRRHARGKLSDQMAGFHRYVSVKYSKRRQVDLAKRDYWWEYLDGRSSL